MFLLPVSIKAQNFKKKRYTAYGATVGASNYVGDLDANFRTINKTDFHIGGFISYRYAPNITLRGMAVYGRVKGDDDNSRDLARFNRNLSFKSYVAEISGHIIIDFFENSGTYYKRVTYTPYMFGGIGVFTFNPKAEIHGKWVELQPLGTEGQGIVGSDYQPNRYSLIQIVLPFGLGYRYKINRNIDIALEMGLRKTFTDYLDDVSTVYPVDQDLIGNNSFLAYELSDRSGDRGPDIDSGYGPGNQRGDPTDDDWYIFTGIQVSYIYRAGGVKCPKFR